MAEITATMVKALRERTGLPMMECKKALQETGGDEQKALEYIRKQGIKTKETRLGRETSAGRIAIYTDFAKGVAAMIELQCESAPVATGKEFMQFANDLAKQLATGPGAASGEELLKQSMSGKTQTFGDALDDMYNRIREVFKLGRVTRIDGACGGYAHHDGSAGALVEVKGGTPEVAKDIAMHVVAFKPAAVSKDDLDPAAVEKEREILTEAARKEGKPENIIGKMIEGRLKNFFAEKVLLEQPFVKDDKRTVGKVADEAKMKVVRFVRWELGKE
ncbi:MAG: translation elongation factor Ts [Planctomycetia bacterium 21-64-5]|nr:MAG: translation elongation factor Ts [Planctomycetia bacterium 21-64-5]HQU43337.1 translation elongation factor Ts [Pirellulales bacterium]